MKKTYLLFAPIENNMASKRVKLNPTVRKVLSVTAIIYFALNVVLYFFQRDLLYFPTAEVKHNFGTLSIPSDSETLKLIVLNEGQSKAIIYFGGNNENVVNQANEHLNDFPNHTIYLVNYRGYSGSTGAPSEQALYTDALTVFDTLSLKYKKITIMGRSLGTGVSTYVAVNRVIEKLILITPFDSIEAIAKEQYPIFPISLLLQDKFDSVSRAPNIKVPTLIIVAEQDNIIPRDNTLNLVRAFSPPILKARVFKGVGHGNVSHLDGYHQLLQSFMAK